MFLWICVLMWNCLKIELDTSFSKAKIETVGTRYYSWEEFWLKKDILYIQPNLSWSWSILTSTFRTRTPGAKGKTISIIFIGSIIFICNNTQSMLRVIRKKVSKISFFRGGGSFIWCYFACFVLFKHQRLIWCVFYV